MEPVVNLLFPNPLHKQALLMTSPFTEARANHSLASCWYIGFISVPSFIFRSPLLAGTCKPNKQTHCLSGRPVRDQACDFPDLFLVIFVTVFREVPGQFLDNFLKHQTIQKKEFDPFPHDFPGGFPDDLPECFPEHFWTNVQCSGLTLPGAGSPSSWV